MAALGLVVGGTRSCLEEEEATPQGFEEKTVAVGLLFTGTYRASTKALDAQVGFATALEQGGACVDVFIVAQTPTDVSVLTQTWGNFPEAPPGSTRSRSMRRRDHFLRVHLLTEADLADEAATIEATTGEPFATKGHLAQWYKNLRALRLVEAAENASGGRRYDVLVKHRFDHAVAVKHGVSAARLLASVAAAPDLIYHLTTDYFLFGARNAMGRILEALETGACGADHQLLNGTEPMPRLVYDAAMARSSTYSMWIFHHAVLPPDAAHYKSPSDYIRRGGHSPAHTTLSVDAPGVYYDNNNYYQVKGAWAPRVPASHACYSESLLANSVLLHNLTVFPGEKVFQATTVHDWGTEWRLNGDFSKCRDRWTKGTPQIGVDRISLLDVKLRGNPGYFTVRVNNYIVHHSETGLVAFLGTYVVPALLECTRDPTTRARVANVKIWVQHKIQPHGRR